MIRITFALTTFVVLVVFAIPDRAQAVCCGSTCCNIDGACRHTGDLNPGNACEECNPAVSQSEWTPISGCGDEDAGTTPPDAGAPAEDSGTAPQDAGGDEEDAGDSDDDDGDDAPTGGGGCAVGDSGSGLGSLLVLLILGHLVSPRGRSRLNERRERSAKS